MSISGNRRLPLTRERVLEAALDLIDADGVAGFSMRKLGRALQVEAMSIYHHFPDKGAIMDGIVDAVYGRIEIPKADAGLPWPEQIESAARAFRGALLEHPGALPIIATRSATGVAGFEVIEGALASFRVAGFSPDYSFYAVNALAAFVIGSCLQQAESPLGPPDVAPPMVRELWRRAVGENDDYPNLHWVAGVGQGSHSHDDQFDVGIHALVNGFVAHRAETGPTSG